MADIGDDENIKRRGLEDTLMTLKHEDEWMHIDYEWTNQEMHHQAC